MNKLYDSVLFYESFKNVSVTVHSFAVTSVLKVSEKNVESAVWTMIDCEPVTLELLAAVRK